MTALSLKILDKDGNIKRGNTSNDEVFLVYEQEYVDGDRIVLTTDETDIHLIVQVDDAMGNAFTYIKKNEVIYHIPFGEKRISYSPKAFTGAMHLLFARIATAWEIANYKNLALNVVDQHGEPGLFPHALANVETRGESVFAARNAIDGVRYTRSHGSWPFESWGINQQEDATIKVDFGRMVEVDRIIMYTRADFPHDNWWVKVTLAFSDGSEIIWDLEKSDTGHVLEFEKKQIEWVQLHDLIKSDDPALFPALTQLEVYGSDA